MMICVLFFLRDRKYIDVWPVPEERLEYRHVGILKDGKYTVKKESWRQLRHRHIDRDCLQLFLQCAATQGVLILYSAKLHKVLLYCR